MTKALVKPDFNVQDLADIDNLIVTLHRKLAALATTLTQRERIVYGGLTERHEAYCHSALTELAKHPDLIPPEAELPVLLEALTLASCQRASFSMLGELSKLTLEIEETIGGDLLAAAVEAHVILNVAEREHNIPPLGGKTPIYRKTGERIQIDKRRH